MKVISVAVGVYDSYNYIDRDGDTRTSITNIIYAVTEDGQLWSRLSDSDEWDKQEGPK